MVANLGEKGFMLLVNGKRFVTLKGKKLWNKKNHATAAFKTALKYRIESAAYNKILYTDADDTLKKYGAIWSHPDVINAWDNFKTQLDIKVIELK